MIPGVDEPTIRIESIEDWASWFSLHSLSESAIWTVILKKSTRRQTVTMEALLEEAICWGWVDVKTKRVDDDWYGIRFVPRRPKSSWTTGNREIACRLISEGRMKPTGLEKLPPDLICPD